MFLSRARALLVSQQVLVGGVAHAAGVAEERADPLVAVHVALKGPLAGEGLLAVAAGQGVHLVVSFHLVSSQVVLLHKLLTARLKHQDDSTAMYLSDCLCCLFLCLLKAYSPANRTGF